MLLKTFVILWMRHYDNIRAAIYCHWIMYCHMRTIPIYCTYFYTVKWNTCCFLWQCRKCTWTELVPEYLRLHSLHREGSLQDPLRLFRNVRVCGFILVNKKSIDFWENFMVLSYSGWIWRFNIRSFPKFHQSDLTDKNNQNLNFGILSTCE